jgi:hypothetical protein
MQLKETKYFLINWELPNPQKIKFYAQSSGKITVSLTAPETLSIRNTEGRASRSHVIMADLCWVVPNNPAGGLGAQPPSEKTTPGELAITGSMQCHPAWIPQRGHGSGNEIPG